MKKLAKKHTPIMFALFMSFLMSVFMSGFITMVNTGVSGDFIGRWAHAWLLAMPCAFVVAYFARPVVLKLVSATVES
jgi:Protein of unknown function (DUF2798)